MPRFHRLFPKIVFGHFLIVATAIGHSDGSGPGRSSRLTTVYMGHIVSGGLGNIFVKAISTMEEPKVFTPSQVSEHNTKGDCWIWIGGKVYDVTNFLEEHPGGEEVILEVAGRDATKDFEDVGHSEAAKEMRNTYLVGVLEGYKLENVSIQKKEASVKREKEKTAFKEVPTSTVKNEEPSTLIKLLQFLVPLLIVGVAFGIRSFFKEAQPSS